MGWNIPEERIKHYVEGIKKGGILMGVPPHDDEDSAYFDKHWDNSENVPRAL